MIISSVSSLLGVLGRKLCLFIKESNAIERKQKLIYGEEKRGAEVI